MEFIYVLRLEGDYFYIGKTRNFTERLKEHRRSSVHANKSNNDFGSKLWLQQHPLLDDYDCIEEKFVKKTDLDEDITTELYMKKYGITKVRGGIYTQTTLPDYMVKTLEKKFLGMDDKCFNCKESGHYASECPSSSSASLSSTDVRSSTPSTPSSSTNDRQTPVSPRSRRSPLKYKSEIGVCWKCGKNHNYPTGYDCAETKDRDGNNIC